MTFLFVFLFVKINSFPVLSLPSTFTGCELDEVSLKYHVVMVSGDQLGQQKFFFQKIMWFSFTLYFAINWSVCN